VLRRERVKWWKFGVSKFKNAILLGGRYVVHKAIIPDIIETTEDIWG
jgi:hypothetical protein